MVDHDQAEDYFSMQGCDLSRALKVTTAKHEIQQGY